MSVIKKIFAWGSVEEPGDPFTQENRDPLLLWRFNEAVPGVKVCFTSRPGGFSIPPYESLNLGYHVGDVQEKVQENRALLCSVLRLDPARLTSPQQRHTAKVQLLDDEERIGSGALSEESAFDPCDGLVTSLGNAPILLHFADCAPVVLTGIGTDLRGEEKPVVAVLHAGRKGLAAGVVAAGVDLMSETYNIKPESMTAAVGAAIGACCYQVSEEIATEMEELFGPDVLARNDEGVWLDMQSGVEAALLAAGLQRENVYVLELCTSCDDHFYSYRRDGVTGRHGAIAWVES
ncbi:MAG: polyphenol oxidase family protein [Thermoleophilia bacterium]